MSVSSNPPSVRVPSLPHFPLSGWTWGRGMEEHGTSRCCTSGITCTI